MTEHEISIENKALETENNDTKVEQLIKYIRKTSLYKQVVPMETAVGWPMPILKEGEVYVMLPFYALSAREKGKTNIYPPLCTITVKWSTKSVVEYVNLRYSNSLPGANWDKEAGSFPHEAIYKMTVREYKYAKKELMGLYDIMLENLNKETALTAPQETRFKELLKTLMEPGLIPYYRSLNKEFFNRYLDVN